MDALTETKQSGAVKILSEISISSKKTLPFHIDIRTPLWKGNNGTKIFSGTYFERRVAVKVKHILDPDSRSVSKETSFLRALDDHQNILRVFTEQQEPRLSYIALELCKCNLQEWIIGATEDPPDLLKNEVLEQCTNGLAYIHSKQIIHRNLCPENILITNCCLVKICGFGLSCQLLDPQTGIEASLDSVGSEGWMAPEVYSFTDQSNAKRVVSSNFLHACIRFLFYKM